MFLSLLASFSFAETPPPPPVAPPPAPEAVASLEGRSGTKVTGTVRFRQEPNGDVKVVIDVANAAPGEHGMHVHEKGDCSAPDGASAGGHFNPGGHQHGMPEAATKHPGDFGNVKVGADGKGHKELTTRSITLLDGPTRVTNLAVIFHERPDDGSQPTGNAGGRQACGVIKPTQ